MKKFKIFLENFLVYGFGGIISKIIPFIMVPIVTRLMPRTEYFGISDLFNTVVSFGSAFAIIGMYDATYRLFFEKEDEQFKKSVCSTALVFTFFTSIIVFIVIVAGKKIIAQYFFGDRNYFYVVYLSAVATLVGATNSIVSLPTRMQNKRKIFLITNTISPIISYAISIPLLLSGYYVIALPVATIISGISMELIFITMNRKWFVLKYFDWKILKQLFVIAIPLFPNFLIYWIFNSCDKVMITNMLGVGDAGIYSVGAKLGSCSQLIYTAFAGGWQFFAFSTMKDENQVKVNSMIFEYLGIISYTVTLFVCAWSYLIFRIFFTEQYINGYIVAPYLFLAPLLQMLFQVAGNQFLVVKKTWPNVLILSIGMILNMIINYTLIPLLGIEGASIATLIGYISSNIVCVVVLVRMDLMAISRRFLVVSFILALYIVLWRLMFVKNIFVGTVMAILVMVMYLYIYKFDIFKLIHMIRRSDSS
jgi:Membrane protein involved in the export of O-antigen and teichoic acid